MSFSATNSWLSINFGRRASIPHPQFDGWGAVIDQSQNRSDGQNIFIGENDVSDFSISSYFPGVTARQHTSRDHQDEQMCWPRYADPYL